MMPTYRTIAIDPPWPQKGGGTLRGREGWHDAQGASLPMKYTTMSIERIAALPVGDLVHPDGCHLYLWVTNGFLPAAFDVLASWGFRYSTTLTWAKTPMGGGLGGALGINQE
jgi:N6-adenosine-specific RNA methylase IME4